MQHELVMCNAGTIEELAPQLWLYRNSRPRTIVLYLRVVKLFFPVLLNNGRDVILCYFKEGPAGVQRKDSIGGMEWIISDLIEDD